MPPLTRWYIKSSLIFLVSAFLVRLLQTLGSQLEISALASALGPVYFHMFLVGWITQLIFGVVFWMFPKYTMQKPRGSETLGWATFGLLNLGLILRIVAEPLHTLNPGAGWGWPLAFSAILQWLAGLGFVLNTWIRVKEK
jgi:hypothetical protein